MRNSKGTEKSKPSKRTSLAATLLNLHAKFQFPGSIEKGDKGGIVKVKKEETLTSPFQSGLESWFLHMLYKF